MSYTPTDWKTGDIITAEKLNNMEDGVQKAGSVYFVGLTFVEHEEGEAPELTLQKTFGEIKNAIEYGSLVVVVCAVEDEGNTRVSAEVPSSIQINSGGGGFVALSGPYEMVAETDNDYPTNVIN